MIFFRVFLHTEAEISLKAKQILEEGFRRLAEGLFMIKNGDRAAGPLNVFVFFDGMTIEFAELEKIVNQAFKENNFKEYGLSKADVFFFTYDIILPQGLLSHIRGSAA